jgi:hypothetical protein
VRARARRPPDAAGRGRVAPAPAVAPVRPGPSLSLAISSPADGPFAVDAARQWQVPGGHRRRDRRRHQALARTEGIFGETAAGVTIASLKKLAEEGTVRSDGRVVVYVTGHNLKTLGAVTPDIGGSSRRRASTPRSRRRPSRRRTWPSPSASRHCARSPTVPGGLGRGGTVGGAQPRRHASGFAERLFDEGGVAPLRQRHVERTWFLDSVSTLVADSRPSASSPRSRAADARGPR